MNGLMGLPIAGGSFEGFALEQLIARFSDRDAYFYRTHGGTECDLIIAPAGKPKFAFDFKLSQSPAVMPSMLETMKDLKIAKGYYIIPGYSTPASNSSPAAVSRRTTFCTTEPPKPRSARCW